MTGESHLGRWLLGIPEGAQDAAGDALAGLTPERLQPVGLAITQGGALARALLKPGEQFAHYRVEQELGRGAMAAVYKARDDRDGRVVALKVLALGEDWPEDRLDEARMRLLREAEATSRLQHPDIVSTYEAGEHAGKVYMAMELVEGVSLATHTCQGRLLPPRMATEMCARVAAALHFAHQHGVVHRDIKPANIVFDQHSRRIRIMDFGVARFANSHATRTGIVLGSPSYMAPEQLDGGLMSGSADQFSLGVTLFQLLTGMLPFRSDSMPGLMQAIATQPHPPLRTVRPDLTEGLSEALDRSLQKDPDARFSSAAGMSQALHDCSRSIAPGLR